MKIELKTHAYNSAKLVPVLKDVIAASRFTADVKDCGYSSQSKSAKGGVVDIKKIRIRGESRVDCEGHPGPCVLPLPWQLVIPRKRSKFLEGADWVEFDDLLNAMCDALGLEANIYSWNRDTDKPGRFVIRKGRQRRVVYDCHEVWRGGFLIGRAWDNNGPADHFKDCIGAIPPTSEFMEGTPGLHSTERASKVVGRVMLDRKLHPARFSQMSGMMAAIVGAFLDREWTSPQLDGFTITTDSLVLGETQGLANDLIGSASDFERNVSNLLDAAELNEIERSVFAELYARKVTDWRREGRAGALAA